MVCRKRTTSHFFLGEASAPFAYFLFEGPCSHAWLFPWNSPMIRACLFFVPILYTLTETVRHFLAILLPCIFYCKTEIWIKFFLVSLENDLMILFSTHSFLKRLWNVTFRCIYADSPHVLLCFFQFSHMNYNRPLMLSSSSVSIFKIRRLTLTLSDLDQRLI